MFFLKDGRHMREAPAFPGQQPPPRQSSQPRPSLHSQQPAFPGIAPPHSPQYGNTYSPQAPSPQNYHCSSPQVSPWRTSFPESTVSGSVVDPDPNWNRIQDLCGSVFQI